MSKFIFVSGGVCSSLGKGVAASCLGSLLESRGFNVRMVKCDPYINANAGTISPIEHGEVYVTDDGAETDLDLGNYARFTKGRLSKINSMTTGQVYRSVMENEKLGAYNGRTIQVIPHITDEIKRRIMAVESADVDIIIAEIGGTVGDIESIPFLETARQIICERGRENAISVHLTLIPIIAGGELKTKPTQHSVKAMQELGIQADILICRSPVLLDEETRKKIGLFTNVSPEAVFTSRDIDKTIYEIPLMFFQQKLDEITLKKLSLPIKDADISNWQNVMKSYQARKGKVSIGIIGQFTVLHDAYKSVYEALFHAGLVCGVEVELVKIDANILTSAGYLDPLTIDAVLIPGDETNEGLQGMILGANWARTYKKPFFGICLGIQIMALEWAKNILKDENLSVLTQAEEGKMRLGEGKSLAKEGSITAASYNCAAANKTENAFYERHRHNMEISKEFATYKDLKGLIISACASESNLVDCLEWPGHPWSVGCIFNPEYKSKPTEASPLFTGFISAAKNAKAVT